MVAALCRRDILDEVRICFGRDLDGFQACPGVMRERCRDATVDVPGVR